MDAFDADVLIYAATVDHPLGRRVRALFPRVLTDATELAGVGSIMLVPELLTKPLRDEAAGELEGLGELLGRLDLRAVDPATARLATILGAEYGLRALDAVHLATAVGSGARRFITNNSSDFPKDITEIAITYPGDLRDPEADR